MPKLLSHIPNSVKGNIIPLSREDYLRQQYQNYLKSQAEKGRKAVVEGREKFAKDYVIPAIKTAGSFTPAGPLIGLADAYNAYQEGNTGWAIAGAGLEALPYAGKIVGKAAPIAKTVAKNLKKDNLKTLIYNNISPVGYTGKKQEIKNLIRDIKYIDNPTIHSNPIRSEIVSGPHSNNFYGLDPQVANRNRNDAWKLYLGIDDKGKSLYIPTNKKDVYRYNPNRISDEATHNFLNQRFDEGQDLLTSNAGGVGRIKTVPSNLPDVQFAKMRDTWDLQPFKDASRSLLSDIPYSDKFIFNPDRVSYRKWVPDKLKNLEIGEFLGVGKPFTVEHSIPYKTSLSYTKHPNRNWWEQFGENIDTPKFTRNRVTDRIVYEKPDYDELIKDIYNKKFDKTFQKGGIIPKAQEGTIFNKTNTQMKNTFATGGQMRNATNSQFVPSYVNGVPVYGFGSWLKKNAGNVLQVAGGIGAMFIPGMQGVGATLIGNGVTGALGQELQDKQQKDAEAMQRADAERSFMLNQYNDSQQVFASPEGFAKGGSIHIDPSKRGTFTAAATKHGQSVQGFASQVLANKDKYSPAMVKKAVFAHNFAKANGGFVPTYEQGGFMNGLKFYNDGGDIDGLTYFPVGGTHESNPNNGIPLGGNALVEEGEFMWESPTRGKYIFSNRF